MSRLDRIRIAKPCPASWSEMEGNDKVRFCSHCEQRVYNLTAMSRDEAEKLLASRSGRLCLRYYRRDDGRIMTRDCPKGVKRVRRQRIFMTGGLLAFLINLAIAANPGGFERGWTTGVRAINIPRKPEMGKGPADPPPTKQAKRAKTSKSSIRITKENRIG